MLTRSVSENGLGRENLSRTEGREDARRYGKFELATRILVTGNTKIEAQPAEAQIRPELMTFPSGRQILIAGSTAPGEEAVIVDAYRELRQRFATLALVIAPRHLERVGDAEKILQASSLLYLKASALSGESSISGADVLLLDTMGDLRALYRRATIAFVGGSLAPGRGGP